LSIVFFCKCLGNLGKYRHFWKCLISANACDIYSTRRLIVSRLMESAAYYNRILLGSHYTSTVHKIRQLIEVSIITFVLAQSDPIKRRTLYWPHSRMVISNIIGDVLRIKYNIKPFLLLKTYHPTKLFLGSKIVKIDKKKVNCFFVDTV